MTDDELTEPKVNGRGQRLLTLLTSYPDNAQFLLDHHLAKDLWCTTDGLLFVKITGGGYMNTHFDLIEYDEEY